MSPWTTRKWISCMRTRRAKVRNLLAAKPRAFARQLTPDRPTHPCAVALRDDIVSNAVEWSTGAAEDWGMTPDKRGVERPKGVLLFASPAQHTPEHNVLPRRSGGDADDAARSSLAAHGGSVGQRSLWRVEKVQDGRCTVLDVRAGSDLHLELCELALRSTVPF